MNTSLKHIGIGFITGFCIGFALKKGIKILSFLLLLYLVLKFFLDYNEMHLSKDMALETSDRAMTYFYDIKNFFKRQIDDINYFNGISSIVGFIAGFKFG